MGVPGAIPNPACPNCLSLARALAQSEARIAALEAQVARLTRRVEELGRAAQRQAAPFSKGEPKPSPSRPGRQAGQRYGPKAHRPIPASPVDEVLDAPLPPACPFCGSGPLVEDRVAAQHQLEIPRRPRHRRIDIHVGHCRRCGQRVQGRHRLQTSQALGCCASQLGPEAQAAVVLLNKDLGLSQGKISRFFQTFFGIRLSRGGSCQILLRAADRLQENYQAIVQRVQASPQIVPDETGWRVGGRPAWLHVAVGQGAVAYRVHARRGREASVLLIGPDYEGALVHDGWPAYGSFDLAVHQACLGHLLRRCRGLLETAVGGAVRFPRQVQALLTEALELRDRRQAGAIQPTTAARRVQGLEQRMEKLIVPPKTHAGHERLAAHLWAHLTELFTFLWRPGLDATNWRAEQALRPAVVNRKVWGGNRTPAGAQAQGILLSVLGTARLLQVQALEFLAQVLQALPGRRPLLLAAGSG